MRAEKLIVKTMWISSDVWTAYCESSSVDIVGSYLVLAITMHFNEGFSVFRQTPFPNNVSNGLSLNKHGLEYQTIFDINNF